MFIRSSFLFVVALFACAVPSAMAVEVTFADANLEAAIRERFADLGAPLGETIDSADLTGVGFTRLVANGRDIASISGIEHCADLTEIDLGDNAISDLTPLSTLTGLTSLYLGIGSAPLLVGIPEDIGVFNSVTDITPLAALTSLAVLDLSGNPDLADISTISLFTGLQVLVLGRNAITDFTPLTTLTTLKSFYSLYNGMTNTDLGYLSGNPSLDWLVVSGNEITSLDPVAALTNIAVVSCRDGLLDDISALAGLPALFYLDFTGNALTGIQPIVDNAEIAGDDLVFLRDNPLSPSSLCDEIPLVQARLTGGVLQFDGVCIPNPRTLTVVLTGTGAIEPLPGESIFTQNTPVNLSATPIAGSGFAFQQWQGDVNTESPYTIITMSDDKSVEAVFVSPGDHTLTILSTGAGQGSVTPGAGAFAFLDGRVALLNAVPAEGAFFGGWTGDLESIQPSDGLLMDGDKTVTARFETSGFPLTVAIDGQGLTDPTPGTYQVATGVQARLTAIDSVAGWVFDRWTGDIGAASPGSRTIEVTINQARSITAVFIDESTLDFDLNLSVNGTGSTSPAPGAPAKRYASGDAASLTAFTTAGSGYAFDQWSGDLSSTNPFETVAMDGDKTITANFVTPGDYDLTVTKTGSGAAGADTFPAPGVHAYLSGRTAIVAALPGAGYFGGWSGDASGISPAVQVEMNADKNVVASFASSGFSLSLNATTGGGVTPPPGAYALASGLVVNLQAFPLLGYTFSNWSGNLGGASAVSPQISVTMNQARTITAVFVPDGKDFNLNLGVIGEGSTGPGPGTPSARFASGEIANIAALTAAGSGYAFKQWLGDLTSENQFENVLMDSDKTITAEFVTPGDFTLTMTKNGNGAALGGTLPSTGAHAYFSGRTATAAVFPGTAYFGGWSGAVTSTDPVIQFVIDGDKSLNANFRTLGQTLTMSAGEGGSTGPDPGVYRYAGGVVVNLEAFPTEPGFSFANWTGDIGGNSPIEPNISVAMDANRSIGAVFVFDGKDWNLDVKVTGTGNTTPAAGIARYLDGETATLTAIGVPGSNYAFSNWSGDVSTTSLSTTLLMDSDKTVEAIFVTPADVTLDISADGPGTTTPAPGPQGYIAGRTARLTAIPNNGRFFAGWSGDVSGFVPSVDLVMNADKTAVAHFANTGFSLAVQQTGQGTVDPPVGAYALAEGTVVPLTATASIAEWRFVYWQGDIGDSDPFSNTISVPIDADRTVKAIFAPVSQSLVSLRVNGPGNSAPAAGDYFYDNGASVYLAALPKPGAVFTHWSGGVSGQQANLKQFFYTVDGDTEITANFAQGQTSLTIELEGQGTVTPAPGTYTHLNTDQVTLSAANISGSPFAFARWEGDIGSSNAAATSITVLMSSNRSITAVFEPQGEGEIDFHAADRDYDSVLSLSELLRVIQFYNAGGLRCAATPDATEDGYLPGTLNGGTGCAPHTTDYNPQDWLISLSELLRAIQFYNSLGYRYCPGDGTEDGFCPGL
jgi:Leucine-rich repeat (LRR) protein